MENIKKERMNSLILQLNYYSDMYYNESKMEISDSEFDSLYDELVQLEKEIGIIMSNSPTQKVGYEIKNKLEKVEHNHLMLSLNKIHSVEEIYNFIHKYGDCVLSLKLDGGTMTLSYDENGDLIRAETRGDGVFGYNVIHNAKKIKNVPIHIQNNGVPFTIDGECNTLLSDFNDFNNKLPLDVEKYTHARNFSNGSVSLLDSKESSKRPIRFTAWRVIFGNENNKMNDRLDFAANLGFEVVPYVVLPKESTIEAIEKNMQLLEHVAKNKGYVIDGLVLVINDIAYGDTLGNTSKYPNYGVAYKYPDGSKETFIRDISWRVGKTGMMAPKAIFDTVILDGTEVSAATLHNLSYIEDMQIGIGSRVKVKKANLIIPKVVERVSEPTFYNPPSICPCCGHPVEIKETKGKDEDGNERTIKTLFCPNDNCTEKNLSKFVQFVSKAGMNIDGLGEKQIEQLINAGYIRKFSDIYRLPNYPEIALLEGWGKKSFEKMCTSIEASKNCKLENYLVALSIPNIGKSAAKIIHKHFKGNWKGFCQALVNNFDFTQLEDFGPKMATSLQEWWSDLTGLDSDLAEFVSFIVDEEKEVRVFSSDNFCNGKTFVVTGKFVKYKRSELEQIITDRGGKLSGSVSKKTNYLLTNEASGSSKYNKAMELNIPIMTEDEFISKIGE